MAAGPRSASQEPNNVISHQDAAAQPTRLYDHGLNRAFRLSNTTRCSYGYLECIDLDLDSVYISRSQVILDLYILRSPLSEYLDTIEQGTQTVQYDEPVQEAAS